MKTIIKKINLYNYEELSQVAKDKALEDYIKDIDYPFLQDDLSEYIHEELVERGFSHETIIPFYDLDYSQGSGLMFTGKVTDKNGNLFIIKHTGSMYYHEKTSSIEGFDKEGEELEDKKLEEFEKDVYIPICLTVRDRGYDYIEHERSEECFKEICYANDYTFLEDGTMCNE